MYNIKVSNQAVCDIQRGDIWGMGEDEKYLLKKAKHGDVEAFEKLIDSYQKKVFNIALRMLGNYDDAGDAAQEVFLRAYKSIKGFKEQSLFSTWIYTITKNVCLDELRKRKGRKLVYIDEEIKVQDNEVKMQIEDDTPTPDIEAEKNEIKQVIEESMKLLSEEHRMIIILRDMQGFSYEDISTILNCPEGTVKSRINRARQALKKILKTKKELFDEEYVK